MREFDFVKAEKAIRAWYSERMNVRLPDLLFNDAPPKLVDSPLFKIVKAFVVLPGYNPDFSFFRAFFMQAVKQVSSDPKYEALFRSSSSNSLERLTNIAVAEIEGAVPDMQAYNEKLLAPVAQYPAGTIIIMPSFYTFEERVQHSMLIHEAAHVLQLSRSLLQRFPFSKEGVAYAISYVHLYGVRTEAEIREELSKGRESLETGDEMFQGYIQASGIGIKASFEVLGVDQRSYASVRNAPIDRILEQETLGEIERRTAVEFLKQSFAQELDAQRSAST